jgi:aspartyl-tRNA(Asn)/glutamyl-tRNA(Gln) amidotransferase subunit A
MAQVPADPLIDGGIEAYGRNLRAGRITAEQATRAYLDRISAYDGKLGAFQYVAAEQAMAAAKAIDGLIRTGTDLGPLMGVPVAIKDLFAVEGMPTTAGSKVDVQDMIGGEGTFVRNLKRAGTIVLGKTKTVEFALGGTGANSVRGTPWNPWDARVHRAPGGSSSGAAVAMAAGLCALAIGSDTGGSVRGPAGFCGVFGLKTTSGLWPLDGIFPLSPTLDTVGPLTRTAADAAIVFAAMTGQAVPHPVRLKGLRLGKPKQFFYEDLDGPTAASCAEALARLEKAGVEIAPVDLPEVEQNGATLGLISPTELIAGLGRERFLRSRNQIDPVVAARADIGLEIKADQYIGMLRLHRQMCEMATQRLQGWDGWITPTRAIVAPPMSEFADFKDGLKLAAITGRNTRPANMMGLCASSSPIHHLTGSPLPVGLHVMCAAKADAHLLSIARAIEDLLGTGTAPDLSGFL